MSDRNRTIEFLTDTELQEWLDFTTNPRLLAELAPMTDEQVEYMLAQPIDVAPCEMDGRSEWLWVRFPNGDLMCGFFPHGDTYLAHEAEREV